MKRNISLLLVFLLCLFLAPAALADSIAEPWGDDFYQEHRREMAREDRYYYTNGAEGYATLCREPEGRAVANLKNGERLYVYCIWEGRWCVVDYEKAGERGSAWIPLEQLAEQYDTVSFVREHAAELTTLEEPRQVEIAALETLAIWDFPGAEAPFTVVVPGELQSYAWFLRDGAAVFSLLYTDPLGRSWGRIEDSKFYGDLWVCLDAPEETAPGYVDGDAVARKAGEGLIPPAEEIPRLRSFPWPALGLTAGAVILAAVLLLAFRKKKRIRRRRK